MSETKKPFSDDVYENVKAQSIFLPLNSAEDLKNWMQLYFDIKFPQGVVYPTSTHGPVDAMWRIYELVKTGENINVPEVVMRASRDSGKSLSAAALEVLCMIHFRISVCHMAAISSQSQKTVQYVELFFRKIRPYLEYHGWSQTSDNQRMIEWIDETGQNLYLKIVIATIAGANCLDPETMVETQSGFKAIKDVNIDFDTVLTRDYRTGKNVFMPVSHKEYTEKQTMEIIFEDGSNLICSTDHQIFGKRGWITADQFKIGDNVIRNYRPEVFNTKISSKEIKPKRNLVQLILGTMLGDGSFHRTPAGSVRYRIGHCADQEEYINEMAKVFDENGIEYRRYEGFKKNPGYENAQKQITLITKTYDLFKDLYKITHIDGKKRVSKKWIDAINEEGLAYLIMDDGSVSTKTIGKGKESYLDIATCSFSDEENQLIIDKLKTYGIEAYIYFAVNSVKKYPIISIKKDDSRKLSELVEPFFVNCLRYKLRTPEKHVRFKRYVDTGNPAKVPSIGTGFTWEDKKTQKRKAGRDLIKAISPQFNLKIVKINRLGKRKLIDISVKTDDNHLKSFFANNILVHNSEHVPLLFVDEIDTIQQVQALNEAKMIPSSFKQYQPLMVYLSTLKFSGGLMEQTMESVRKAGGEIYSWNILDITEKIPDDVARVDEPKVVRYITSNLPMSNISPEEFNSLKEDDKLKYERIEAYAGIATHPMLPVMKNYLVDRPDGDHGGMYKKLSQTHNLFKKLPEDMANAQLLCLKPSSSNLVYPRFDEEANVISIHELYEKVTGNEAPEDLSLEELRQALVSSDMEFIGGADWGYTDFTSLVVIMITPSQDAYILDHYLAEQIEFDDVTVAMGELERAWGIDRWYVDQAEPDKIATLRRKKFKVPSFTKVVGDGLSAVQYMICDATGRRRLFVLNSPNTQEIISSFGKYRWAVDGKGDPIGGKPYHGRDNGGISDIQDSIRYPFQVLFSKSGKKPTATVVTQAKPERISFGASAEEIKQAHSNQLMSHVHGGNVPKPITTTPSAPQAPENTGQKKKKGVFWSI